MPVYPGKRIDSTPGWRVALLLLGFVVVAVVVDKITQWLERVLAKHHGLLEASRKLKKEIFQLGVVSLLLIAAQESLLRICVHKKAAPTKGPKRAVLAAVGGGAYCGKNQEPFWTAETIFQTHILLFVTAVVHVLYTTLTMVLCMWKVSTWHKFEDAARTSNVIQVCQRIHTQLGSSTLSHLVRVLVAQFRPHPINLPVYSNVRLLFIERMQVSQQYNFHAFLLESMERQLAHCVEVEWGMWVLAALLLALPSQWYGIYVLAGAAVLVTVVVAVKLGSVAVYLAAMLSFKFSDDALLDRMEAADPKDLTQKPMLARTSLVPLGARTAPNRLEPVLSITSASATAQGSKAACAFPMCLSGAQRGESASSDRIPVGQAPAGAAAQGGDGGGWCGSLQTRYPVPCWRGGSDTTEGDSPASGSRAGAPNLSRGSISQQRLERQRRRVAKVPDAAGLFWRGRPQLVLQAFKLVFFISSMSLALLVFHAWQGTTSSWIFVHARSAYLVPLAAVNVLVLVHSALSVLPTYALIEPVGSHCPESILALALKLGVRPEETTTLVRISRARSPTREPTPLPPDSPPAPRPMSSLMRRSVGAIEAFVGLPRSTKSATDLPSLARPSPSPALAADAAAAAAAVLATATATAAGAAAAAAGTAGASSSLGGALRPPRSRSGSPAPGAAGEDAAWRERNQGSLGALIGEMYKAALDRTRAEIAAVGPEGPAIAASFTMEELGDVAVRLAESQGGSPTSPLSPRFAPFDILAPPPNPLVPDPAAVLHAAAACLSPRHAAMPDGSAGMIHPPLPPRMGSPLRPASSTSSGSSSPRPSSTSTQHPLPPHAGPNTPAHAPPASSPPQAAPQPQHSPRTSPVTSSPSTLRRSSATASPAPAPLTLGPSSSAAAAAQSAPSPSPMASAFALIATPPSLPQHPAATPATTSRTQPPASPTTQATTTTMPAAPAAPQPMTPSPQQHPPPTTSPRLNRASTGTLSPPASRRPHPPLTLDLPRATTAAAAAPPALSPRTLATCSTPLGAATTPRNRSGHTSLHTVRQLFVLADASPPLSPKGPHSPRSPAEAPLPTSPAAATSTPNGTPHTAPHLPTSAAPGGGPLQQAAGTPAPAPAASTVMASATVMVAVAAATPGAAAAAMTAATAAVRADGVVVVGNGAAAAGAMTVAGAGTAAGPHHAPHGNVAQNGDAAVANGVGAARGADTAAALPDGCAAGRTAPAPACTRHPAREPNGIGAPAGNGAPTCPDDPMCTDAPDSKAGTAATATHASATALLGNGTASAKAPTAPRGCPEAGAGAAASQVRPVAAGRGADAGAAAGAAASKKLLTDMHGSVDLLDSFSMAMPDAQMFEGGLHDPSEVFP